MKATGEYQVAAGKFKARCLALLDDVARTRRPIVVTKRGKPVAKLVPVTEPRLPSLRGSVKRERDIISPVGGAWDADR